MGYIYSDGWKMGYIERWVGDGIYTAMGVMWDIYTAMGGRWDIYSDGWEM